jgi:hypothetical protein
MTASGNGTTPPTRSNRLVLLAFCILAVVVTAFVWSGLSIRDVLAVAGH